MASSAAKEREAALDRAKQQLKLNLYEYLGRIVAESDNWPKTLAELTGIGVTSAQRYLNPDRPDYSFPRLDQIMLMADGLKITVSQLLRGVSLRPGGLSADRLWAGIDDPDRLDY